LAVAILWSFLGNSLSSGAGRAAPNTFLVSLGGPLKNAPIQIVDRSGAVVARLPSEGGRAFWSPDGRRVAFTRAEPAEVWVADANGANARVIHRTSGLVSDLAWSLDGLRIYCSHHPSFFPGDLFALPSAGGPPQTILPVSEGVSFPQISPDGKLLAYFRGLDNSRTSQPPYALKVLDLVAGQAHDLVSQDNWNLTGLDWTNDGRALLISVSGEGARQCALERVELNNPRRQPLTQPASYYFSSFSRIPGSDTIAMLASPRLANGNLDEGRSTEIWLVDPRNGQHTVVTSRLSARPSSLHASPISVSGGAAGTAAPPELIPSSLPVSGESGVQPSVPPPPPLGPRRSPNR
jgi:Tol biopolymer transport system component